MNQDSNTFIGYCLLVSHSWAKVTMISSSSDPVPIWIIAYWFCIDLPTIFDEF